MISKLLHYMIRLQNKQEEMIWANVWHDTIRGIDWLSDLGSLSPGRAGVGYNYLYVMTRILEEKKPNSILDLGLGISSTLISEYFKKYGNDSSEHIILEHDKSWGAFYTNNHRLSDKSIIVYQEREVQNEGKNDYYAFKKEQLKLALRGKRFSVISIDAPAGSLKKHSRRDIISLIPDILEDSWVILMDDAERLGEKTTINDIKAVLKKNQISFKEGLYKGVSYVNILTSEDNAFLCTL